MGKGRPRKPAAMLKLTGSERAGERAAAEVPMAAGDLVRPDSLLDEGARRWWKKLTKQLTATPGLITPDNGIALAMLCSALSTYEQANAELATTGITILEDGKIKRNPALIVRERAFNEIRMGCAQFGITPADRSKITTVGSDSSTPGSGYIRA